MKNFSTPDVYNYFGKPEADFTTIFIFCLNVSLLYIQRK
jgi:hypothetical protein